MGTCDICGVLVSLIFKGFKDKSTQALSLSILKFFWLVPFPLFVFPVTITLPTWSRLGGHCSMSLLSLLHSRHKLPLRSVSLIFNGFVVFIFKVGYRYCFINSAASALQWQYGCHSAVYLHLLVSLRHRLVRKEFACFYFN